MPEQGNIALANKVLFAGTVLANNVLFAGTVPAKNSIPIFLHKGPINLIISLGYYIYYGVLVDKHLGFIQPYGHLAIKRPYWGHKKMTMRMSKLINVVKELN